MVGRILVGMVAGVLFVAFSTAAVAHNPNKHRSGGRGDPMFSQSGGNAEQFGRGGRHRHGHRQDNPMSSERVLQLLQGNDF